MNRSINIMVVYIIQITAYMDEYEIDDTSIIKVVDTEAKAKEYCDRKNNKYHDPNIHYFYNEHQVE